MALSSEVLNEPVKHRWRFKLIFIVAFVLTAATYALEFGLGIYFQQFFQSIFQNGGTNLYQWYYLAESAVNFAFNPVICFLIFYKIASRISIQTLSNHLHLLLNLFAGGLVGYAVSYLFLIAYETSITLSVSIAGPNTDWFLWSATFAFGLLRGSIDIAFLGFAAIVVGALRSTAKVASAAPLESVTLPSSTGTSV